MTRRRVALAAGGVMLALFVGVAVRNRSRALHGYEQRPPGSLTFAADIAPIVYRECTPCHRPGGSAPFSLTTFEEVSSLADRVAATTSSGRMPPWLPAAGHGAFAGERRLTVDEIGRIAQWAREGARPGDLAKSPPLPDWPAGWQLGTPDLVVEMDAPYHVVGGAPEEFRNFVFETHLDEVRWVRSVELLPGNPSIVHHAMLMVEPTPASRILDQADSAPGYDGMHAGGSANVPPGFFLGWTPGRVPSPGEQGLSWKLTPGADLVLQLHLRPRMKPDSVRARIGLHFDTVPPKRVVTTIRLGSEAMDIPAGEPRYVVDDSYVLPVDVAVLGLYPHAHYLGHVVQSWAELPDRSRRWLIDIPEWDFNWQDEYRFAEPVALPRGTRLVLRLVYDNSARNPRNPNSPPKRVAYGPRSVDEMGDLWISVQLRDSLSATVLHRDYARKEFDRRVRGLQQMVRLDPRHPNAHRQLGLAMLSIGRLDDAIRHYRQQLDVTPDDNGARYGLAYALQSAGRVDEAIAEYRAALAAAPDQAATHNNLGNALLASGEIDSAMVHYRRAVAIDSTLADAHNNLGIALVGTGRIAEGLSHAREAARLRPQWAVPLTVMAWTLATHPDDAVRRPAQAIALADRAVRITGRGDPSVLNTLAAAYAAAGEYDRAVVTAEEAMQLALAQGASVLASEIAGLASLYRAKRPYREQPRLAGR